MLCEFHFKQAVERWVRSGKHGVPRDVRTLVVKDLERLAHSMSRGEYSANVSTILARDYYKSNIRFQRYFDFWTERKTFWVLYFKDVRGRFGNTNNGVERMNGILKKKYLHGRRNNSLSYLLDQLLNKLVKTQIERYKRAQRVMVRAVTLKAGVPPYLNQRPPWLIKHVTSMMDRVIKEDFVAGNVLQHNDGTVSVDSATDECTYTVSMTTEIPTCTCLYSKKTDRPCKHFFAALLYSEWTWETLPEHIRTHPMFSADHTFASQVTVSIKKKRPLSWINNKVPIVEIIFSRLSIPAT